MQKILFVILVLLLLSSSNLYAKETIKDPGLTTLFGLTGKLQINAHTGIGLINLTDPLDSIYIGTINTTTGLHFGSQAMLMVPIGLGLSIGPNFNYNFSVCSGSWYNFTFHEFSIGPIVKFDLGGSALFASANYDLGFVSAEQIFWPGSFATIKPPGSVVANVRGLIIGVQGYFPINKQFAIGPYANYGSRSMLAFEYKNLGASEWINIDFTDFSFGATVFYQ